MTIVGQKDGGFYTGEIQPLPPNSLTVSFCPLAIAMVLTIWSVPLTTVQQRGSVTAIAIFAGLRRIIDSAEASVPGPLFWFLWT